MDEKELLKPLPDKQYLKLAYKRFQGEKLDLNNPQRLTEKLQWLKLYYRNPLLKTLVDKYAVKSYVGNKIGFEHVVENYGVWNHFDEIDFESLPDQFVLKCTHDSGTYVICSDKQTFDIEAARKAINEGLKTDHFARYREWAYKDVPHRIIAEEYIDSLGHPESVEYKVTCFNGKVAFTTICGGIAHAAYEQRTNDSFDRDGNYMPWHVNYNNAPIRPSLPKEIDKLVELSEILAADLPEVRVDWYLDQGRILFGEMTFYTWAGFMKFDPPEWDLKLGQMFELPENKWE